MKCWIITEGLAGTENQCLGVAEALGVEPVVKKVNLKQPWKSLSPWLGCESEKTFDPPLTGPWPDLLIASGRKSIAASRYIKKASGGKTFTVQIQDPRIGPENFDLVALPAHDPTRGDNVLVTDASPNRITKEKLAAAKEKFKEFEKLPEPRIAVLFGGSTKDYTLDGDIIDMIADHCIDAGIMVTASRRTGESNMARIKERLNKTTAYIWDGTGENPYLGMLAWADHIIVTGDSASMLSDAATTGKPVHIARLKGNSRRLDKLHERLVERGIARVMEPLWKPETWTYEPLRDSQKIADEIRKRLAGHMAAQV